MLDRTIAPGSEEIEHFDFKHATTSFLENGIPLHCLEAGTQEVLKLELIFRAGSAQEAIPMASFFCMKLLLEGTVNHSAEEIANTLDFYGAQIEPHAGLEYSSLNLYCINKHFDKIVDLLIELINKPTFPASELKILKQQKIENINLNKEYTSYLAMKEFHQILFPDYHYGYSPKEEDVHAIDSEICRDFFETHLKHNFEIIVSGKIDEKVIDQIENRFGDIEMSFDPEEKYFEEKHPNPNSDKIYLEKPDAVQCSLRIGRRLISKKHPDFQNLVILNTIIGGYFGSRLMKKIREEKGYTYGIHSSLIGLFNTGYWYISADIKSDKIESALKDIYRELELLRTEPIGLEELELVKNHILGQFLSSINNPFSLGDKFKSVYLYGLNYDYFDNLLESIKSISPDTLMELASKYLKETDLTEVVCGPAKP